MNDIWKSINQIAGGHSNLRLAIHKKEDLNEKKVDEWTPYMWAVRCGLQEAADELKDAGADTSGHYDAALLNAVLNNDLQRGIHALENGANPNRRFAGSSIISMLNDGELSRSVGSWATKESTSSRTSASAM